MATVDLVINGTKEIRLHFNGARWEIGGLPDAVGLKASEVVTYLEDENYISPSDAPMVKRILKRARKAQIADYPYLG